MAYLYRSLRHSKRRHKVSSGEKKVLLLAVIICLVGGIVLSFTIVGIPKLVNNIFLNLQDKVAQDVIKKGTALSKDKEKLKKEYEKILDKKR